MNYNEVKSAVRHLLKTSQCAGCKNKYNFEDVHVLATTKSEGLFELRCKHCNSSTLVTIFLTPLQSTPTSTKQNLQPEITTTREHQKISKNDILDMKNFLNKFDGNFKKIFINEQ